MVTVYFYLQAQFFFEYTVQFGRIVQLGQRLIQLTRMHYWLHEGLSHAYLRQFWSALWGLCLCRQISYFMWMMCMLDSSLGLGLPQQGNPLCVRCSLSMLESMHHCCGLAPPLIWCGGLFVCSFLEWGFQQGYITWDAVCWLQTCNWPRVSSEGEEIDSVFMLSSSAYSLASLDMIPYCKIG